MATTGPKRAHNIWSIPATEPFLKVLAKALQDGSLLQSGGKPASALDLAETTILLPTNRAVRALQAAFLEASPNRALILPKIRSISQGDEDQTLIAQSVHAVGQSLEELLAHQAMPELERRLKLTELVLMWSRAMRAQTVDDPAQVMTAAGAGTPAQASKLAGELAQLLDLVETEGVDLNALKDLVPEDFAEHWGKTLTFLKIVTETWPQVLNERQMTSAVRERNRRLEAEAMRYVAQPPAYPVFVAGVTGSIPATRQLIKAVAELPNGAVVLPAFDGILAQDERALIAEQHPEHPQFGLLTLLAEIGVDPDNVRSLGSPVTQEAAARQMFLHQAMRPPAGTAQWPAYVADANKEDVEKGLNSIEVVEAPTAADEAEVVALVLREALETPGRTAALVSPDRLLARRVVTRLEAWGIKVDDSAGRPFRKTPPGAYLDLVIEAWSSQFAPEAVVALLKHPFARLGLDAFSAKKAARALEIGALRGPVFAAGLDGIAKRLSAAHGAQENGRAASRAARQLWSEDWINAQTVLKNVSDAFAPLSTLEGKTVPLHTFARAHVTVAEALAKTPEPDRPTLLWQGDAGEAGWTLFQGMLDPGVASLALEADDYPDFYRGLVASENVRARVPLHPRLAIWGPFEARLQQPDVVVLGSLNDGTWPEAADPGPWLNRPMREALKLPQPEAAIGYLAHDMASLLAGPRVVMTRALKIDGVPTVASRWLLRIKALLTGLDCQHVLNSKKPWLAWARSRDAAPVRMPARRPEPAPPVVLRPRKLSVTAIEKWLADPYAIYAQHILQLEPMPDLGASPDASLRGQILHEAMGRFAQRYPSALPADIKTALMTEARAAMGEALIHERVRAFWWPRLERFAEWFAETEQQRRTGVQHSLAEVEGAMVLAGAELPFTLKARADRLDVTPSGVVIYDYKTGSAPSQAAVIEGRSPQLPLEAAIVAAQGFAGIASAEPTALKYISAKGGEPPGVETLIKVDDVRALVSDQVRRLEDLIKRYDHEATPYLALRRPNGFDGHYRNSSYGQLARVKEWSGDDGEGGEA
jgi:ATP-dependent helicase/nuclease subunit B